MIPPDDHLGLDFDLKGNSTDAPRIPAAWIKWFELLAKAPDLKQFLRSRGNQSRPPAALSDAMFVAFIRWFADPVKAEILRAVLLDSLAPDIRAQRQLATLSYQYPATSDTEATKQAAAAL